MRSDVLLVGGAGSVGRRLTERLKRSVDVLVLDRVPYPEDPEVRSFICDLSSRGAWPGELSSLPSDLTVVFLAGKLGNDFSTSGVRASLDDNVGSVATLVNGLADHLRHLILVSTISVYGTPTACPIRESDAIAPTSLYGATKAAGELIARTLCAHRSIPLSIVRATQLFDLSSASHTLPHELVRRLPDEAASFRLTCEPGCLRDYLHVEDFTELLVAMIRRPTEGIFHAGSGRDTTIGEVFASAFQAFGLSLDLDSLRSPEPGHASSLRLDTGLTERTFGWSARKSVHDWFREKAEERASRSA